MTKNLDTQSEQYTERLVQQPLWKSFLNVQAPYRWKLNSLNPAYTLEIGCGVGRNLSHLQGNGVGIDHNIKSVEAARKRGFEAFAESDFFASSFAVENSFDSLLFSHVFEHLGVSAATDLVRKYLPFLKKTGKLIVITPQEAGQSSDPTHVEFMDFKNVEKVFQALNLSTFSQESFPFPRVAGKVFPYNEFVSVAKFSSKF